MKHFLGRRLPESGDPVGYSALVARYDLKVPLPSRLTAIAKRHHPKSTRDWQMLTPTHAPDESLQGQLEFAVKWEGVSLGVLSALFRRLDPDEIVRIIHDKPTGAYARRIWFLYEWLTELRLEVPDAGKVRAVPVVDPTQQFAPETGPLSRRHRVRNNLPGTNKFCPLVRRTPDLDRYVELGLNTKAINVIGRTHPDVVRRAAAFLLLEDSKASFEIEGERPSQDRALRWGQAIGDAGQRDLTVEELERLQEIVIGDARLVRLGLRIEGGWLGDHDRRTGESIPSHIGARHEDLQDMMQGVVDYEQRTHGSSIDPVVVAAALSFGFVYIHPFEDGNGRLHRWLIHHVLARAGYNPPGLVFPVSAPMLRQITDYRGVLESYSRQVLPLVEWRPTEGGNVAVLNETSDYYRFFDATNHAEFLYQCVEATVTHDLPREVEYLEGYDEFSKHVQDDIADMPARTINLLAAFLEQNGGSLSKWTGGREFDQLSPEEVEHIEKLYARCFPKQRLKLAE